MVHADMGCPRIHPREESSEHRLREDLGALAWLHHGLSIFQRQYESDSWKISKGVCYFYGLDVSLLLGPASSENRSVRKGFGGPSSWMSSKMLRRRLSPAH
jgi:hypothetical protein